MITQEELSKIFGTEHFDPQNLNIDQKRMLGQEITRRVDMGEAKKLDDAGQAKWDDVKKRGR